MDSSNKVSPANFNSRKNLYPAKMVVDSSRQAPQADRTAQKNTSIVPSLQINNVNITKNKQVTANPLSKDYAQVKMQD